MRGVKAFTGAAASVLLLALHGPDARLGRHDRGGAGARLSEQSAAQCAACAGARHRRERAAGAVGLSPEGRGHRERGLPIYRYAQHRRAATPNRLVQHRYSRRQSRRAASAPPSRRRCSTASRPRTGPARRRARFPARAKRLRVLEQTVLLSGRHDLHGLSARFRDRRGAEEQRSRARADAEADARPLQCRRSHAHRRCAVGGAARRRQDAAADRRSQSDHDALELPPHHRQRAGKRSRRARRSIASCRRRCRPPSSSA